MYFSLPAPPPSYDVFSSLTLFSMPYRPPSPVPASPPALSICYRMDFSRQGRPNKYNIVPGTEYPGSSSHQAASQLSLCTDGRMGSQVHAATLPLHSCSSATRYTTHEYAHKTVVPGLTLNINSSTWHVKYCGILGTEVSIGLIVTNLKSGRRPDPFSRGATIDGGSLLPFSPTAYISSA